MTIAPNPPARARRASALARMEIAWSVSAGALGSSRSYSSAVLHLTCAWDPTGSGAGAECAAILQQANAERPVPVPASVEVRATRSGAWIHLSISAPGAKPLLIASFEHGRLVYCTSSAPEAAGLRGGTYDAPTGILELYDQN